MALHIVNEESLGGRLGTAVGGGISGLLDNLVRNKAQEMQQKRNAQGYQEAWNLSPEQAQFVSSQSPEFQQDFVKALHAQQQAEAFDRAIHPERYPSQPSAKPDFQPNPKPSLEETMGNMGTQPPQDAIAMALQKGLQQAQMGQSASIPQESLANVGQRLPNGPQQLPGPQQPNPQGRNIADILANRPLNPNLQAKAEEVNEKRRSNDIKERGQAYDRNKKQIDALHDESAQAEKDIHTLKQIKAYNATGKLIQGPLRDLLEKFGMENLFTNEPTQVTAKLIAGMSTGVAEAYGATPRSNLFLKTYQETLPRMINTKDGLATIADNKILEREAVPIVNKELRKLEHQYNKTKEPYPYDILELAREHAKPETDKLLAKSEKNIADFIKRDNADIVEQLPPANRSKGDPKINAERGIVAESDGKRWNIRLATPEELSGEEV